MNLLDKNSKFNNRYYVISSGFFLYLVSDLIFFSTLLTIYLYNYIIYDYTIFFKSKDIFFVILETFLILLINSLCNKLKICIYKNEKINFLLNLFYLLILNLFILFFNFKKILNFFYLSNSLFSSLLVIILFHFFHFIIGFFWNLFIIFNLYLNSLNNKNLINIYCLSLFYNFLNIIWIFIFNFLYIFNLMGAHK
ncbi:MAG: hypothetical protein ACG0KC_01555 [Enterobacteriaceae bacterium]